MAPKSVTLRRHDHLVSVLFGDLLSHSYNITFSMFLYLVTVVFADFACQSYQHNNLEMFLYLVHSLFLVVALATTVSALVDEGTFGYIKVQHSWKKQLSCSGSVDEGPTKNIEPMFI